MAKSKSIKTPDRETPLRLEWLRSFLEVIERDGFTKAARSLRLSQPAVSTHVRELEESTGRKLLEHGGGAIRLTPAGEAVAREARRILEDVRELRSAVEESEAGVRGVVRIGASTTPGNYILPPLLGDFERRHPDARAALTTGNTAQIMDLLRVNEVDLGVVGSEPDPEEFLAERFVRDEIVLFASPDHRFARKRAAWKDLAGERFLLRERESATRRTFEAREAAHGVRMTTMELSCPETVKRAAAAGLGIGILSRHAIEWERREGRLVEIRVPGFPLRRWLYTVRHRRKRVSRLVRALLTVLSGYR